MGKKSFYETTAWGLFIGSYIVFAAMSFMLVVTKIEENKEIERLNIEVQKTYPDTVYVWPQCNDSLYINNVAKRLNKK